MAGRRPSKANEIRQPRGVEVLSGRRVIASEVNIASFDLSAYLKERETRGSEL